MSGSQSRTVPSQLAEASNGLNLLAAEAAAEAAGHHQAAGRRTAAIAATTKADALSAQCEGARTPALDARQAHDLTPRELEIATMAARGMSSKEIGGRLVVSVRTVDNTLRQAYAKLAVNNRADLRLLLAPERNATRHRRDLRHVSGFNGLSSAIVRCNQPT